MWRDKFDPKSRQIRVRALLVGPHGSVYANCLFDTGAPVTILSPAIVDQIGYSPRMGKHATRLAAIGVQEGYNIDVERLETMGFTVAPCEVWCHDFDDGIGIDGLIGMDLMEGRVVHIDGVIGEISVGS